MYKAIDWRMRVPFKSFSENKIFIAAESENAPESAKKFSMELLLQEMDKAGVEIGVVPYRCGQNQEDISELMEQYPQRFRCLAHVDPYGDLSEIDRYILNGKAAGAIVEPGQTFIKRPVAADDRIMMPIYQKCLDNDILLTITYGGLFADSVDWYKPVYIENIAKEFPQLNIVLTHGGWPYVNEICHVAYQFSNVILSPDWYLMSAHPGHEGYVAVANNMLQDRVIFGSLYPASTLDFAVSEYVNSGLTPVALEKVLYTNAAKLLKII